MCHASDAATNDQLTDGGPSKAKISETKLMKHRSIRLKLSGQRVSVHTIGRGCAGAIGSNYFHRVGVETIWTQ
jgi:hypothetical protein